MHHILLEDFADLLDEVSVDLLRLLVFMCLVVVMVVVAVVCQWLQSYGLSLGLHVLAVVFTHLWLCLFGLIQEKLCNRVL